MAEKVPKRKAKPKPSAGGVLGTLPASRPERLGAPRAKAKPKVVAERPAAKRAPRKSAAKPRNGHHGPQAVTPGASSLRTRTSKPPPRPIGPPRGTELVTTTIRAAGELAQIGFTVGGHTLKRALDRIPRPGSRSSGSSTP